MVAPRTSGLPTLATSRSRTAAATPSSTCPCFAQGKIKHIGVSNFGVEQLKEALATGVSIVSNEICYNLIFRAVEFEIVPFCR